MNIEQTKRAIEVMQSFVDGKEIQSDSGLTFNGENCNNPVWNWPSVNYFVKPEPVERWIAVWEEDLKDDLVRSYCYPSKATCTANCLTTNGFIKAIKLVEET